MLYHGPHYHFRHVRKLAVDWSDFYIIPEYDHCTKVAYGVNYFDSFFLYSVFYWLAYSKCTFPDRYFNKEHIEYHKGTLG